MLRSRISIATVFVLATALGCAHPVKRSATVPASDSDALPQEEVTLPDFGDPVEPWNRSTGVFNHVMIVGVIAPLGRGYRAVTPRFLRTRITNFATNLIYPLRLLASLLQGELRGAGDETLRFGVNTTVGVLGLFDPASGWGIEPSDEDFGQVFAKWGWRSSSYLVLPFFGPSSTRDGIGLVPDTAANPATYFFPAGPVFTFNNQVDSIDLYKRFVESTFDPYHLARLVWTLNRNRQIVDFDYEPEDTAAVQTLQVLFLTSQNPGFPASLRTRSIEHPSTGRRLPYTFRIQPDPAPILFILPGLGAHRLSDNSVALAEMAYVEGFSVAILSNAMNFEFMQRGSTAAVPGHTPVDAHDVHVALDEIYADVKKRYAERITSRALMGYSLGAFHTFFIAAAAERDDTDLIDFDRYITLDAPVQLLHGMQELDGYFNAPLIFPPEERAARIRFILRKALDLGQGDLTPEEELRFSNVEAEFLIGLAFRLILQGIIFDSQQREDLGVLRTQRSSFRRWAAYQEIGEYSFTEYLYHFVLPYYRDRRGLVASEDELFEMNDLRAIAEELRASGKIRHFANTNDFLTTDEDVEWLSQVLGESNVRFFTEGGHLGGLYKPEVQHAVMEALRELVPSASEDGD